MTLSMRDPRGAVSRGGTYQSAGSPAQPAAIKQNRVSDPWACKMESFAANRGRHKSSLGRVQSGALTECFKMALGTVSKRIKCRRR